MGSVVKELTVINNSHTYPNFFIFILILSSIAAHVSKFSTFLHAFQIEFCMTFSYLKFKIQCWRGKNCEAPFYMSFLFPHAPSSVQIQVFARYFASLCQYLKLASLCQYLKLAKHIFTQIWSGKVLWYNAKKFLNLDYIWRKERHRCAWTEAL